MKTVNTVSDSEIVIFNSPIYRDPQDDGEYYLPPLGQGYIVTNLQQHGIQASLIDCVYNKMGIFYLSLNQEPLIMQDLMFFL